MGQFDPIFFNSMATVQAQIKDVFGYMLLFWYFTILERGKHLRFLIFSAEKYFFLFSMYMKYYLTHLFLPEFVVTFSNLGPSTRLNKLCSKFEKKLRFLLELGRTSTFLLTAF